MEHCWGGLAEGCRCSRGCIGCPLPHPDDPRDLRLAEPRGTLDWNPVGVAYPGDIYEPTCPRHGCANSYGGGVWFCPACPPLRRVLQRLGVAAWVRQGRRARRRKREFMRSLRARPDQAAN